MNLETIQLFCDLVEGQNFSRAAEKHGISQSAVSQQIAQLEIFHKTQLINRKKRPLKLTDSGEIFYRGCKDILERYEKLKNDLNELSDSPSRIKISAIFSIGMHTLQPYVKNLMSRFPKLVVNVEYLGSQQIYSKVLEGKSEIGVVAVPTNVRNIEVYPLESEPLVLVCSPSHPFATEEIIDVHSLQGQEFIAFEKNVPTRVLINNILKQYDVAVNTVMQFDNTETIKRAVEINAGISILPEPTVKAEVKNRTLRKINFSNKNFFRPIAIIVRKKKTMSLAGRHLIELLTKNLRFEE
jgi:DNA-binding transcriptional LysR family regulator